MATNSFRFDSTDPARDRSRFFLELRAFGQSCGWPERISNEIELILEEWWTNLINYAFVGMAKPLVQVDIKCTTSVAHMQVVDNGVLFDPSARADPDLNAPVEERPIGGLGIYMMKKLSTKFTSERKGDHNVLRIEKDLTRPVLGTRA